MRKLVLIAFVFSLFAGIAYGKSPLKMQYKSGFLKTPDGVSLHYIEAGRGPAILFVPGWMMPAEIWEPQLAHFSATHRVVAFDPRGSGRSTHTAEGLYPAARARDIKAMIDQLKLSPVVLVGWSMGVKVLAAYADHFGTGGVDGFVLVDGNAGYDYDPAVIMKWVMDLVVGLQQDRVGWTTEFVRGMYLTPQSDEYIKSVVDATLLTPTNSAITLIAANGASDFRPALQKIDKPTLIITGSTSKEFEDMHRRIPESQIEVFQGAGHAVFVDAADRFNTRLDEFLKTIREQNR